MVISLRIIKTSVDPKNVTNCRSVVIKKIQLVKYCLNEATFYCYPEPTGTIIRDNSNWGMGIFVVAAPLQETT